MTKTATYFDGEMLLFILDIFVLQPIFAGGQSSPNGWPYFRRGLL